MQLLFLSQNQTRTNSIPLTLDISLINTLGKTLEKIVNKRFVWHLETSNILTNGQCGFRRNHSTLDTLSSLYNDICNAKYQKQHLILIALDLEKAYDIVWRNRALKIIQKCVINSKMFIFLQNFLKNHSIQAHNELSNTYLIKNGLSQGSVISVVMFLLAINKMFKEIPKPIKHLLFANDCHIYCSGQNIKTTIDRNTTTSTQYFPKLIKQDRFQIFPREKSMYLFPRSHDREPQIIP